MAQRRDGERIALYFLLGRLTKSIEQRLPGGEKVIDEIRREIQWVIESDNWASIDPDFKEGAEFFWGLTLGISSEESNEDEQQKSE